MASAEDNVTITAYDKFADVYDAEVIDFWRNFPPTTTDAFVENLPGRRVLDLGSGSGRDAILLREAGCNVECIDGSATMVAMTSKLGFPSKLIRFEGLTLPEARYDGVWAYTSLLHVAPSTMEKILLSLTKALVPRGVLLLGMIEGDFAGMVERDSMPGAKRYFKYYTTSQLEKLVEPLGFKKIFEERYSPRSKTYLHHIYQSVNN